MIETNLQLSSVYYMTRSRKSDKMHVTAFHPSQGGNRYDCDCEGWFFNQKCWHVANVQMAIFKGIEGCSNPNYPKLISNLVDVQGEKDEN